MPTLIPAQRSSPVTEQAPDTTLTHWAFENHAQACQVCTHDLDYCPAGRALLQATAHRGDPDIPGYLTEAVPHYPSI